MADDRLTGSMQENAISLAMWDNKYGRIVIERTEPEMFEGDYRTIMEAVQDYWERYNKPPKQHTADLLEHVFEEKPARKKVFDKTIHDAWALWKDGINEQYVIDELSTLDELRQTKEALVDSVERINQLEEGALPEIKQIWADLLKQRRATFNPGINLSDLDTVFDYIHSIQSAEFLTNIPELDRNFVVPQRGTVLLLVGPTGMGKSRFLTHLGKTALVLRKKVLHITLEMSAAEVSMRYLQALFALPKRQREAVLTHLEFDEDFNQLKDVYQETYEADTFLTDPKARKYIESQITSGFKGKLDNLMIKQFPGTTLTVQDMEAYLDTLEATHNFIPDLILLDYLKLMKMDKRDLRISIGSTMEEFRALLQKRNIAGVTVQQSSREGAKADKLTATHVAEDWSLIHTSDTVVTMYATEAELQRGLMHLWVPKSRGERDKFGVLVATAYDLGQFCLESCYWKDDYASIIQEAAPIFETEEEEGWED